MYLVCRAKGGHLGHPVDPLLGTDGAAYTVAVPCHEGGTKEENQDERKENKKKGGKKERKKRRMEGRMIGSGVSISCCKVRK